MQSFSSTVEEMSNLLASKQTRNLGNFLDIPHGLEAQLDFAERGHISGTRRRHADDS